MGGSAGNLGASYCRGRQLLLCSIFKLLTLPAAPEAFSLSLIHPQLCRPFFNLHAPLCACYPLSLLTQTPSFRLPLPAVMGMKDCGSGEAEIQLCSDEYLNAQYVPRLQTLAGVDEMVDAIGKSYGEMVSSLVVATVKGRTRLSQHRNRFAWGRALGGKAKGCRTRRQWEVRAVWGCAHM